MESKNRYKEELAVLDTYSKLRCLPQSVLDKSVIEMSSNDYLGLNKDEKLYEEFICGLVHTKPRFSSVSSRLLGGGAQEHQLLEDLIADCYRPKSCLLYNSGYHANLGILPALAGAKDLIIADKLVHASIIDGATLSKAKLMRYKHQDYGHLERILSKNRKLYDNIFVVSESIFSMDGDVVDLNKLVALKNKYDYFLYIDEAHALGTRGVNGYGYAEELGLRDEVDFIVGTFGKALASVGAFVVCKEVYKQYLVNYSRSLIYSTALPPINLAWTKFIFERLPEFTQQREKLDSIRLEFSKLINAASQSNIIPYIIGGNKDALRYSDLLRKEGFNALPIRYPTVPNGTARLRFSLSADMDIQKLSPIRKIVLDETCMIKSLPHTKVIEKDVPSELLKQIINR